MKKAIALLILINMTLFASVSSFAANIPKDITPKVTTPKAIISTKGEKIKPSPETKVLYAKILGLEKQAEKNKKKLDRLRNQSLKACNAAKTRLSALQKRKNKLTKDQIDALIEDIKLLKQYIDELNSMKTDISMEDQNLKDAKSQNNPELVIQALNEIIASQNERISHFQKIISGLNQIAVV
ncbi:MAG TPA: hypothetical protein VHT34_13805 [Clostridia bacterium]|nr:hypothetical protein [Clostridia bacterium]